MSRPEGPRRPAAAVVRLTLSYRGTAYAGWQRQANALAVQQVVEEALSRLVGEPVVVTGASRTDAGVHARGQVAHLALAREWPARALVHGTNRLLPEDVRVLAAAPAAATFHARKDAIAKRYRYRLRREEVLSPLDAPFALRVDRPLDLAALAEATAHLVGRHDFTAFALAGGGHGQPCRTLLDAHWQEAGPELDLLVTGDGFLRGMVRSLVGTLLEVAHGRRPAADLPRLLAGRPREEAGPTAPAHGLVLQEVFYPEGAG